MDKEFTELGFEIAVIGMAARFPGAQNTMEFWENLKNGVESIIFLNHKELEEAGVSQEWSDKPDYVKARGLLQESEYFDHSFFGYSPREAELMSPQIRVFHECAWTALEEAGYTPDSYNGLIGLYAGASPGFDWEARSRLSGRVNRYGVYGSAQLISKDFLCTRVSHKLDLKGPSLVVDTACSTSLVAVHTACQALINGECDMALAGGISIRFLQKTGYMYQEGMIAAPDGHCRAFDARAKGMIGGEGAGIVVLKRFRDATADRDHIYALVKGSAINNDGIRKVGFTAPSIEGQAEVIKAARQMAEVEPESITYVETHGTGTPLGDPVEIEALKLAFATKNKGYCAIGSVKTNIGHLDAGAGVAGLIKTVLALKYKLIPPSLHFETPNPKINFEDSPFYVNTQLKEWKYEKYPLRACVSSFGIGGTNAHTILEEAPGIGESMGKPEQTASSYQLITLSAKTDSALERMTVNLADYSMKNPDFNLADAAYTLQVGRKAFPHRRVMVCTNPVEGATLLSSPGSSSCETIYFPGEHEEMEVVFMFSGQGTQYVNMGLELYTTEPVFRQEMDRCFEILKPLMGKDIKEILYPPTPGSIPHAIDQTEIAQPLLFIFEYALAKLLIHWGIKPDAMIGHSIGEYTAAHLSGVFTLEDTLKIVALRGKLMQRVPTGAMLSVPLPAQDIIPLLNKDLSLAAVNSSSLCVVSGSQESVTDFSRSLQEKGYDCTLLHTSHAFHSKMMDPVLEPFKEQVKQTPVNEPEIPYISNLTGTWIKEGDIRDPGYWANHLRQTVQFSDGLKELLKKDNTIFVEVGPGSSLSGCVKKHKHKKTGHFVVNLIRHPRENLTDRCYLLHKIGQLWLYGKPLDWVKFHSFETRYRISLPTYPFEGTRYEAGQAPNEVASQVLVKRKRPRGKLDPVRWFYLPSWERTGLPPRDNLKNKEKKRFLLITNGNELGDRLAKRLSQGGDEVIVASRGAVFSREKDDRYQLNPMETNEYGTLFAELQAKGKIPHKIIHLLGITGNNEQNPGPQGFTDAQESGFYSVLHLAKAVGKLNLKDDILIDIVTDNMQPVTGEEELCPGKATVLGPVKVIPQEYGNIICRSIDIVLPSPGSLREEKLSDQVLLECTTTSPDRLIAYRGDYRWTQSFKPVPLKKLLEDKASLREKGVYLVTGGLGNVGFALSRYLARSVKARLILTGRSGFPPREEWKELLNSNDDSKPIITRIKNVLQLEELGAEVLVKKADVANLLQMQEVISRAEQQFGPVNGVIHAAGVITVEALQFIRDLDKTLCEKHFQPKVHGLYTLEKLFYDKPLDFCLVTSSLASLLGGLGYTAYAAANLFMDAFVHRHNNDRRRRWISVNWDGWQFSEEDSQPKDNKAEPHKLSITPGEGEQVFQCILAWGVENQVVVSSGDLQTRINQWIKLESVKTKDKPDSRETSPMQPRPEMLTPYTPPESQLEKMIIDILQNFFGYEQIGRHDNFFDLGASSLDLVQLNRQLGEKLNKKISVVLWFEYSTINSLAAYLEQEESHEANTQADEVTPQETERTEAISRGQMKLGKLKKQLKGTAHE